MENLCLLILPCTLSSNNNVQLWFSYILHLIPNKKFVPINIYNTIFRLFSELISPKVQVAVGHSYNSKQSSLYSSRDPVILNVMHCPIEPFAQGTPIRMIWSNT